MPFLSRGHALAIVLSGFSCYFCDIILVSPESPHIMSAQLSPAQQLKKVKQKEDQRLYKQTRNSGDMGKSRHKMIHTNIRQRGGKTKIRYLSADSWPTFFYKTTPITISCFAMTAQRLKTLPRGKPCNKCCAQSQTQHRGMSHLLI